jgi:glycosyltransferase involved in cell wall biosynthesis
VKPRVLHVVSAGEIGGAERVVADLAAPRADGAAEHAVALWAPSAALSRFLRAHDVVVHDGGPAPEHAAAYLGRALGSRAVRWLEEVIRRELITTVHLHTFASQVPGTRAAVRTGVALVRTEHSTRVFKNALCWPFSRWSLRRCDAAVAVSDYVLRVALARAPWAAPRLRVIRNGVAPRPARAPRPAGPFRFIAVGRLDPRKGLDLALGALALLPDAHLDVVGDGTERAALEDQVARAGLGGRVTFHGYVADPGPLVARADAALSGAADEGLGLALLEAMSAGLPVVAVPVGGILEVVRDGETGWLARARTPAALAEAMRAAAGDAVRARALGDAARRQVAARFSLDAMRLAYDDLYRTVAARCYEGAQTLRWRESTRATPGA